MPHYVANHMNSYNGTSSTPINMSTQLYTHWQLELYQCMIIPFNFLPKNLFSLLPYSCLVKTEQVLQKYLKYQYCPKICPALMVQDIEKGIQSHSQWLILYLSFWLGGLLGCGSCAYLMTPSPEHSAERRDAPIRDANFPTFGCIGCEICKASSQIQIWLILIPKMHWIAFKEGVL